MFERASRIKLRFETKIGDLTVEDLWHLPLTSTTGKVNLDEIALGLNQKVNPGVPVSFVDSEVSTVGEDTKLAFEVVKHIIKIRLDERKLATEAKERAEKKQRLLGLIAKKEDEKLADTPLDDLKKMVEAL